MKKTIVATLLLATAMATTASALDITLAENINSNLSQNIEKDFDIISNFKFKDNALKETLLIMGLTTLNAQTASAWLNTRVNYIISEKALSPMSLLLKKTVFIDRKDAIFPNPELIPYSMQQLLIDPNNKENSTTDSKTKTTTFTIMSNVGSALYMQGKVEKQVYGMKISRGLFKKAEKVSVTSPRIGIIQIGEGLFAPELTVNQTNPDAMANSIFRLGTFFHEARHSDGHGISLAFTHALCPAEHDYAGQPACDESLNGPYAVGALMIAEMSRACEANCSAAENETLKILFIDSANRILETTHKKEQATFWDPSPESL